MSEINTNVDRAFRALKALAEYSQGDYGITDHWSLLTDVSTSDVEVLVVDLLGDLHHAVRYLYAGDQAPLVGPAELLDAALERGRRHWECEEDDNGQVGQVPG